MKMTLLTFCLFAYCLFALLIKVMDVQECDARKASFIFLCLVQKISSLYLQYPALINLFSANAQGMICVEKH